MAPLLLTPEQHDLIDSLAETLPGPGDESARLLTGLVAYVVLLHDERLEAALKAASRAR